MPTYEYKCKSCGHELEIFHSMSEAPRRKCPECKKSTLERQIGIGAAVLFKGSGFYQTDYRSASYKKAAESEKAPPSSSEGSAAPKADSKPASASDGPKETKAPSASETSSKPAEKKAADPKTAKPKKPRDAA
jgi:putative FmdB family regulatory protein